MVSSTTPIRSSTSSSANYLKTFSIFENEYSPNQKERDFLNDLEEWISVGSMKSHPTSTGVPHLSASGTTARNGTVHAPGEDIYDIGSNHQSSPQKQNGESAKPLSLDFTGKIVTTQQFLNWSDTVQVDMERGQEDVYRNYLTVLKSYLNATEDILSKTTECERLLDSLEESYVFVQSKTQGLQTTCENVLDEQNHLISVTEELTQKLAYFNQLEPILQFLMTPGENIVLEDKFMTTLEKLDQCLSFLLEHTTYRDAEIYKMRYRQSMTRCMTLIKMYFVECMRSLQSEIKERLDARASNDPLPAHLQVPLLYVKFRSQSARLKPLIHEIEIRCHAHPEYFGLLKECCQSYFSTRRAVLLPFVQTHVNEMQKDVEVLQFASNGCAYIIQLCRDEYQLFRHFFSMNDDDLSAYLENISMVLYDQLRPLILREWRIDALSELCHSLINFLHSTSLPRVTSPVASSADEKEQGQLSASTHSSGDEVNLNAIDEEEMQFIEQDENSPIKIIIHRILEDTQQRLCFRAETFIRQDLQNFKPREQEILVLARQKGLPEPVMIQSAISVESVLAESVERARSSVADNVPTSPSLQESLESTSFLDSNGNPVEGTFVIGKMAYGGGEWYPTLQRALYILSRLHGCIPDPIFQDLADDAINSCRTSLVLAHDIISHKLTRLDGQLFLMKNLLMLREQMAAFGGHFVRKEEKLDFAQLMYTLKTAIQSTWNFGALANLSRSLLSGNGGPRVVAEYNDARESLDVELKKVCESFILETAKASVEPVSSFMLKVSAFDLRNNVRSGTSHRVETLSSQNFAQPNQILLVYKAFMETLENRLESALAKMKNYLGDRKTQLILIRIIRSNILDNYAPFREKMDREYTTDITSSLGTLNTVGAIIDGICEKLLIARRESISAEPAQSLA